MNNENVIGMLDVIWKIFVALVGLIIYKFIPGIRTKISRNKHYNVNTTFWLVEYELLGTLVGCIVALLCSVNFSESTLERIIWETNEWAYVGIVLMYILGVGIIVKITTEKKPGKYFSNIFYAIMIFVIFSAQLLLVLGEQYDEQYDVIVYLVVLGIILLQALTNIKTDKVKSIKYRVITQKEEYITLCEPIKKEKYYFIRMTDEKGNETRMIQISEDKIEKIEYEIENLDKILKSEKGLKKDTFSIKWEWIKFKYSIAFTCVIMILLSVILFVICYFQFAKDSIMYEIAFALFSGVIASTIVTLIVDGKQQKDIWEKKKALLFDVGYVLAKYAEDYQIFHDNQPLEFDMKIKYLYSICTEPVKYIINLYKNNSEIFDVVEITFIRKLNSTYYFINKLFDSELSDEAIKDYFSAGLSEESKGMQKYWEMLNTLNENLFYLKIKWEKDKMI